MIKTLRVLGAVVLVIIALPVAIIAGLFSKPRKCTAEEFASELKDFANGVADEMAWDRLESVPIADPRLESIRKEAMTVSLPLQPEDQAKLRFLASEALAFAARPIHRD